jgi:putative endonuclease
VHFVYILRSLKTGRFYVGQTNDLIARFKQHQDGAMSSTKGYRPWCVAYYEVLDTRSEALRREKQIKRKKSAESIRRIIARGYARSGLPVHASG